MKSLPKLIRPKLCFLLLTMFAAGCSSTQVTIVPMPRPNAEKLGHVEGSAGGALGVYATAYYFIPMGLNSRTERAYQAALAKAPGATALTDVTIQENWYWFVLIIWRQVTITGEAVR